jgi:hypothetical protein
VQCGHLPSGGVQISTGREHCIHNRLQLGRLSFARLLENTTPTFMAFVLHTDHVRAHLHQRQAEESCNFSVTACKCNGVRVELFDGLEIRSS